jgi:hypothetical protein
MFQQAFEKQQQMQGVYQKLHLDWWCCGTKLGRCENPNCG